MRIASDFSKPDKRVFRWLITGCFLIVLMIIIGGITRLTQSGLSMVKWEPIMGTLPPLSQDAWNDVFELYKQSPEFEYYNAHFTLSDFKSIYFWEYLHRLIARILGLVFVIPCIVFWVKGYFSKQLKKRVLLIFIFGALQGVLGWVMVKSGLVDQPHVSHYRLAAHLITALGLLVYIFWVAIGLKYTIIANSNLIIRKYIRVFISLLFVQIIYGAFVAGLKAGLIYNTFPKMGSEWIPKSFGTILHRDGLMNLFESHGIVQFIHRVIAFLLLGVILFIALKARKQSLAVIQKTALNGLIGILAIQILLGIVTLLYSVPIFFGVMHQFVAILVLLFSVFFLFTLTQSKTKISS